MMKIIFFGSDDFAAVHLEQILACRHEVLCCVTSVDKPQGRGMKIGISPIKKMALERNIPCLQPASLKSQAIVHALRAYEADIFVVVAFGYLLTQEILDIPKMFCINVHPSLLPQYRGAAPINWAILNGDKETGVTVQKMALELDAGDIIVQERTPVLDDENAAQLRQRLAKLGAKLLVKVLEQCSSGQYSLTEQKAGQVLYAYKLTRQMGAIDWAKPARFIFNQVRGLQPWPGACTSYNGKMLKIFKAVVTTEDVIKHVPGQVINVDKNGFVVAAGDKGLLIKEVQPQAGRVMSAVSFAAGHKIVPGCQFL
jgi:methionyl-tRNA formyltransferase